jgi:hypothetical protein
MPGRTRSLRNRHFCLPSPGSIFSSFCLCHGKLWGQSGHVVGVKSYSGDKRHGFGERDAGRWLELTLLGARIFCLALIAIFAGSSSGHPGHTDAQCPGSKKMRGATRAAGGEITSRRRQGQ